MAINTAESDNTANGILLSLNCMNILKTQGEKDFEYSKYYLILFGINCIRKSQVTLPCMLTTHTVMPPHA